MADVHAWLQPYLDFEQTQWTNGSVEEDSFYQAPSFSSQDKPGKVLKVEEVTGTTRYLLPPGISMSRFIYLSESVGGLPVPVSASILWRFAPRKRQAPFPIALHGYVVVATDYAGLGIVQDPSGNRITHPYLCSASHALDVVFSVQTAQAAFPALSQDFITIGHSQGGGATWAVAEQQVQHPTPRCIGCIAVSPPIHILEEEEPFASLLSTAISEGLKAVFPEADVSAYLTSIGQERMAMMSHTKAGVSAGLSLLLGVELTKPGYTDDMNLRKYAELSAVGGKPTDPKLSAAASHRAALRTAEIFPEASVTYVALPGITHDAALTAGQSVWMDWIAARFEGKPLPTGFAKRTVDSARPMASYHPEMNWYLAPATEPYHVP